MKDFYPEVSEKSDFIQNVIRKEEERFHETLQEGLAILEKIMKQEKEKGSYIFPGNEVFVLYDTYGFPKELTEEYIQDEGFQIDEAGFEKEMAAQRQRARAARQNVDSMQVQDQVLREIHVESQFTGYEQLTIQSTVAALIKDRQEVQEVNQGDEAYLFLKETPFYAESGVRLRMKESSNQKTEKLLYWTFKKRQMDNIYIALK